MLGLVDKDRLTEVLKFSVESISAGTLEMVKVEEGDDEDDGEEDGLGEEVEEGEGEPWIFIEIMSEVIAVPLVLLPVYRHALIL